ncbi:hypothetical protein ACFQZ4_49260 [Catellatospora coxensis]|uniref:Uncharacterized protein n=1 Tax=Catellatospora coxensis TaxID=310354 RepID=A0A8J3KTS1_9ACTN|nr:hypothetical protein [Catellatospora coxensis]GIG08922.1 hypothetical protein Cco03nite_56220 [Catellatospora coxensis]
MISRVWIGLGAVLLAVVGLLSGWRIDQSGGDAGVLAAVALLALAAGCLLAAGAGGEVVVRATGGALFVAGLAVVVTHHELWWWLPISWVTPVSLAALVVSLVGVGVLLLAYGFRLAGLSGALGLLALVCLALTFLPYLGSEEKSVLRAFATALGSVALAAGVGAATTGRTAGRRRTMTAVAGVLGAAVTVYAGFDSYPVYASGGHHAAVIGATIIGATASLALGAAVSWPDIVGGLRWKASSPGRTAGPDTAVPPTAAIPEQLHEPSPLASPESSPQAPAEPTQPYPPAGSVTPQAVPSVVVIEPSVTTAASPAAAEGAPRPADRLQTASLAVGLAIGLITIAKELIAAFLAIIQ